jgi:protein SCO1/2
MPMLRRELLFTGLAGLVSWSFCAMPGPAQSALPPEGSKIKFSLTSTDGTSVTEQNYRGKWLVVYFGYTFCPDVCPTTMMEIAGALAALGSRADVVQAIFITVDPQRDTPVILNDYLKSFDPRIVGLTGSRAQTAAAAKALRVFYERRDLENGTYLYDHSAYIYLIDPEGKLAKAINADEGRQTVTETLSALMTAR